MRDSVPLTIGDVARRLGCQGWQVRRLFQRGLLPEAARVGAYRVVSERDLPLVEKALREAGYLPPGEVQHAG
jgi:DNA-binding transcriptional MerR regulator